MPIMLATYSTNKIIVLKRYVSEIRKRKKEININQTNTRTQTNNNTPAALDITIAIFLDDTLTWSHYIDNVYSKLMKYVGIFYKIRSKLPLSILRNIYFAFVYPHILYGTEIYANTSSIHF